MAIDDSFKKPGSVPFKWEIRPGVPKPLNHHHHQPSSNHISSPLKPPPSSPTSFHFPSPRTQSNRFRTDKPITIAKQPDVVSLGCFHNRKGDSQRKTNKLHVDPVYISDLERLSRWSLSTRRSGSPFHDSPLSSSSFSSYRSSPQTTSVNDAEWAGFDN